MPLHSDKQLQQMFEEFGLGSEEQRQRFLDMSQGGPSAPDRSPRGFVVRLGNSSAESCLVGGEEHAELERDPR